MPSSEVNTVPGWDWSWFRRTGLQAQEKEESEVRRWVEFTRVKHIF